MEQNRVTLADVATACGVTKMTVSRALREGTTVSAGTRERVRAAAERLGYKPDAFLSGLAAHRRAADTGVRRATLAYVTHYRENTSFRGWRQWAIYQGFFNGAQARADILGYGLEEFSIPAVGGHERAAQVLASRGYAGLIMAPVGSAAGFTRLRVDEFATVTLGYSIRKPRLHRVVHDYFQSVQDILHELKHRGYQRPGLAITRERDARTMHRWTAGFRSWQELYLKPARRVPLCFEEQPAMEQAMPAWFRREKPDVVITPLVTDGQPLLNAGIRFPEDAGWATLSLLPDHFGKVSGFSEETTALGAAAVDMLHVLVVRGERGVPELARGVQVAGRWHEGPTLRPPLTPAKR